MELDVIFRFFFALVFTLSLIGMLYWGIRRFGLIRFPNYGSLEKRLLIIEVLKIDAKNRLVLFKRDSREHLILLGQESSLLIESPIKEVGNNTPFHEELNAQKSGMGE
jgi:flagellar protein FliO/FliZ